MCKLNHDEISKEYKFCPYCGMELKPNKTTNEETIEITHEKTIDPVQFMTFTDEGYQSYLDKPFDPDAAAKYIAKKVKTAETFNEYACSMEFLNARYGHTMTFTRSEFEKEFNPTFKVASVSKLVNAGLVGVAGVQYYNLEIEHGTKVERYFNRYVVNPQWQKTLLLAYEILENEIEEKITKQETIIEKLKTKLAGISETAHRVLLAK